MTARDAAAAVVIGGTTIVPVLDGVMEVPARRIFQGGGDARVPQTANGVLSFPLGALLVLAGDRVVLVDAGVGPDAGPPPGDRRVPLRRYLASARGLSGAALDDAVDDGARSRVSGGQLLGRLEQLGVRPQDVTDVVLTHLHFDHIGWVSRDGAPTFPRARYWCHEADAEWFLGGSSDERYLMIVHGARRAEEILDPVRSALELWADETELLPGVTLRWAPGHTRGSAIVVFASDDRRALTLGDVVHCPQQLESELDVLVDMDPEAARETRARIIEEVADGRTLVTAAHFAGFRFGTVTYHGVRRTWCDAREAV